MFTDEITVTGRLNVILVDQMGIVKEEHDFDNLVVGAGKSYIASRMKDATATAMSHMAIGTGTTAAASAQTALVTEANRQALTSTSVCQVLLLLTQLHLEQVMEQELSQKLAYSTLVLVVLCFAVQYLV